MTDMVVLLAGWLTDPEELGPLRASLGRERIRAEVWSYRANRGLADLGRSVATRVEARRNGSPGVHLVGHSLGGLTASTAAPGHLDGLARSVTTINTPWRGTWMGSTERSTPARDLRWGSPTLTGLRGRPADHLDLRLGPGWLVLSCAGDPAVPATTALRPGARARRLDLRLLPAVGHTQALQNERVIDTVAAHVGGTRAGRTDSGAGPGIPVAEPPDQAHGLAMPPR